VGCGVSAPARLQGGLGGLSRFIGWAGGWGFSRLIRLILNHLPLPFLNHSESFSSHFAVKPFRGVGRS
jgi:hypothetical protein